MSNNYDFNDGIVIFSDTGNVMFTSVGGIIENKKSLRKHKINKHIIHKCFDNMREYTECEYWDRFLSRCSKNIFPNKNFKFTNNILYYKIKNKKNNSNIFIDEENLQESFINLKKFLRDKGIKPNSEVKLKEYFFERDPVEINNWKDIKKELKGEKIKNYIDKLTNQYNLIDKEINHLESLIKIGLAGDIFNNNNIIIEKEEIKEIKYLMWNDNNREFYADVENMPLKYSKSSKSKDDSIFYTYHSFTNDNTMITKEIESVDIGKRWEKFLDNFYNKKINE